jgi:hypothetical protein
MVETTFFDPLDFVTRNHDACISREDVETCTAQMELALLRGLTPLISQTQAFDSCVVLNAASEPDDSGACFRWLIENGHIRVPLFNQNTLVDAFISAVNNPDFRFLCWPQLNGVNASVDRNAIISALRARRHPSELPSQIAAQVETVQALSSSVESCKRKFSAWRPAMTLSAVLMRAHSEANRRGDPVAPLLQSMLDLRSDSWSAHFAHLRKAPTHLRARATEILDMSYTFVVSDSLRADHCSFRGIDDNAITIMRNVVSEDKPQQGIIGRSNETGFPPVGWREIKEFYKDISDLAVGEKERLALAAGLLARISMEQGSILHFVPRTLNGLYLGILGLGGALAIKSLHGQPDPVVSAFISVFIPAFLGEATSIKQQVEDFMGAQIKGHYLGLLNRRISKPG